MENSEQPQSSPDGTKLMASLSCFGIVIVLLAFASGIAGSYLGFQILKPETEGSSQISESNVTINEDSAVIDVVNQNQESVVSVLISRKATASEKKIQERLGEAIEETVKIGEGSGFIISADGLLITNRHVIGTDNAEFTVLFDNGESLEATVLAIDSLLDIAILKVDPGDLTLNPVELGTSQNLKVGQRVIAIGNSLGEFSGTVSYGIVSGLSRSIVASDRIGGTSERLNDVIQTDASINPGNSGGPLFDIQGNVIGVNVAVAQDAENIGFAIPIDTVKRIVSDVNEFGEIRRPFLGVRYQIVTPALMESNKLESDFGALIIGNGKNAPAIVSDSPAEEAGLQDGDLILSIDGQTINQNNPLQELIQNKRVGDKVEIVFVRNGSEQTTTAILVQLE